MLLLELTQNITSTPDTAELHNLLENIKSIPYVTSLQWSEMVEMIGDNGPLVITAFFNRSKPPYRIVYDEYYREAHRNHDNIRLCSRIYFQYYVGKPDH